jgi:hypothetical protein
MGVLIIGLMCVFRLGLETHKQRIAILEPENMKLKKECQHLKKVSFFHATVICFRSSYCCPYISMGQENQLTNVHSCVLRV